MGAISDRAFPSSHTFVFSSRILTTSSFLGYVTLKTWSHTSFFFIIRIPYSRTLWPNLWSFHFPYVIRRVGMILSMFKVRQSSQGYMVSQNLDLLIIMSDSLSHNGYCPSLPARVLKHSFQMCWRMRFFRPVDFNGGQYFPPRGHLAMSEDIFVCHSFGGGVSGATGT